MSWWRKERERDLERELRAHLELEAVERRALGLSEEQSRFAAQRALGNAGLIREDTRAAWGCTSLERLAQDLRYGMRALRKNPGFTLATVLTLALGIGANTAMFSIVFGVLMRPLPYPDADRVALVHVRFSPQNAEYGTMSIADYLDWKSRNHVFEDPAIFSNASWRFQLTGAAQPIEVQGCAVTDNFFSVLRSSPMLGRVFRAGESAPNAGHVVVLSDGLWRDHFNSDPAVIGKAVNLSGDAAVIIGVMPVSFRLPAGEQLWTNLRLRPPTRRGPFPYIGIGRLKPGVTFEQAQAETNSIGRQIELANPVNYRHLVMPILSLREGLTGKVRPALLVMFGAVFLVLLIATVNVANLILVRSNGRAREMALRLSLGAGRGRLLRQLLTENILLGFCGGAGGLALAWLGIHGLRVWNPGNLPRLEDVHLDVRALAFTFIVSVMSAVVFGLLPSLRSSGTDPNSTLKQGGRGGTAKAGKGSVQNVLVIAEVALSFTLLIVGGLLLRSFVQLEQIDAGFQADPQHVLTMRIARGHSAAASHREGFRRILERVRALPGVEAAALSDSLPPDRQADYDTFQIEGQPWSQAAFPGITTVVASEDYFRTLRVPLVSGRYFTNADLGAGPGSIVISESVARRYFPGETPIGHRIAPSGPDNHNPWMTIVGVVRDVKYTGLDSASDPALYPLDKDWPDSQQLNLVVRSPIAFTLSSSIEREIHAIDPDATLSEIGTLASVKSASVAQPRFRTMLIGGFACVALLLSAIGIYGVIAYTVVQRTNEIGIRMALGAQRGVVLKQVVGDGAVLALAGVAIGCVCALPASRALAGLLFSTSATDPMTFAVVIILLIAVAVVASLVPAVRATRIDPIAALRSE